LSLERVLRTLEGFGLDRLAAEVYVHLAKKGPQEGADIADALKLRKHNLHAILKTLQDKGVVTASVKYPLMFSAVAFERALDLLVEANIEQAKVIQETKDELLSEWREMIKRNNT
jgi:sugar-specific transcriptional regulator TrmB